MAVGGKCNNKGDNTEEGEEENKKYESEAKGSEQRRRELSKG